MVTKLLGAKQRIKFGKSHSKYSKVWISTAKIVKTLCFSDAGGLPDDANVHEGGAGGHSGAQVPGSPGLPGAIRHLGQERGGPRPRLQQEDPGHGDWQPRGQVNADADDVVM